MASNNPFELPKSSMEQGKTPKRQLSSNPSLDAARGLRSDENTRPKAQHILDQLAQSVFGTMQQESNPEGKLPYEIQNPLNEEAKQRRQMDFGRWLNRNEAARNGVAEDFKKALVLMDGNEPLLKSMISSLPVEESASLLIRYCTCRLKGLVQLNEVQVQASTEPDKARMALAELKWQTDEIHRFSQSLQDLYGSSSSRDTGSGQIEPPKNEIYDPKNLSNRLQSLEAYINSFDFGKVKDGQSERQFCDRIKGRVEKIIAERDHCEGDKTNGRQEYNQAKAREFEKHAHYHLLLLDRCKNQLEEKEQHTQSWVGKAESVLQAKFYDNFYGIHVLRNASPEEKRLIRVGRTLDTGESRRAYYEVIMGIDWGAMQTRSQEQAYHYP